MSEVRTKAKQQPKSEKKQVIDKGPWLYVGPSIPGVATNRDMYVDKIPDALTEKAKEIVAINELILPVKNAVGIEKQLESGRLKNMYDSVLKKLREGE